MEKNRKRVINGAVLIFVVFSAGLLWQYLQPTPVPTGIAVGNGRVEATEYDIATKWSGRVKQVLVEEGDMVVADQVLALMDTQNLEAQLREANARLREVEEGRNYALAIVEQRKSELLYAETELRRSQQLLTKGHVSKERLDQHRTAKLSSEAALRAAQVQVLQATASIDAAAARIERLNTEIADSQLKSPVGSRVLYRLAEAGEVVPFGGKVLTVLDLSDVYMTIFLPTAEAGRVRIGSNARITLDAVAGLVIPAKVSFVSARAQFTPREVETRTEREKLMFRIKVKIDPNILLAHIDQVKTGVPGMAYIKLDPQAEWPTFLETRFPSNNSASGKPEAKQQSQSIAPEAASSSRADPALENKNTLSPP